MFFLGVGVTVVGAAARNIGLTPARVGYLLTAQNLGFMLSVTITGALSDRYRKPPLLCAGSVILALSFLSFYAVDAYWVNFIIMIIIGVGIGVYEGATDTVLLDVHSKNESVYITFNHFFVSIGSLGITAYLLYLQADWRKAVVQTSVVVAGLAIVYGLTVIPDERRIGRSFLDVTRLLKKQRILVALFIAQTCAIGLGGGTIGLITSYLMEIRGFTQVTSKVGLMLFLSGLAIGRLITGSLIKPGQIVKLISGLFGVAVALFIVLYFVPMPEWILYVVILFSGFSISPILPMLIALPGLIFRDMAGTAMGVIKAAIPFGGIVIPFAIALVADSFSFQASLIAFPVTALIGFFAFISSASEVERRLSASADP